MLHIIYLILILIVAIYSIVTGFRRGITGQVASVLGLSFGGVAARVLTPEYSNHFEWATHLSQASEFSDFTVNLFCAVAIYFIVYWVFYLFSFILNKILSIIYIGIFNRILGAFFCLLKNLLWLSIGFNLLLCISKDSQLLKYEKASDGNLVSGVMSLTHAILGCDGAEEFAHYNQLKEAKTISCNFNAHRDVIITQG